MNKISAILLAAGKSKRFNHPVKKQFFKINNCPLIKYVVDKFLSLKYISQIILVIDEKDFKTVKRILNTDKYNALDFVIGGKERFDSVFNAVKYLHKDSKLVIVHDVARPLVSKNLIERCLKEIKNYDCVIPGIPIVDTIKSIKKNFEVVKTIDRNNLFLVQTPQVFKREVIEYIYSKEVLYKWTRKIKITDDSQIAELEGFKVKVVMGEKTNIKITSKEDINLIRAFLKQ